MGNSRRWTTKLNATTKALEAFVSKRAGRSITKRKQAREWAAVRPNSLPPVERARP